MNKLNLAASIVAGFVIGFTGAANAKEWQYRALDISSGTVKEVSHGSTCNYASAVSAARKATIALGDNGAIVLKGIDNPSCSMPAAPVAVNVPPAQ